jgi:hemerythrin
MDMQIQFPARQRGESFATPGTEYIHLAEQRQRVFALISDFRKAVARPRGRSDAVRVLKAILPCSGAYFSIVESLLDKLTATGAAPHHQEHRRILAEIQEALARCSDGEAKPVAADLLHALDTLIMHEAAIRIRGSMDAH